MAEAGNDVHVVTGLPHHPQWEIARGYRRRRLQTAAGDYPTVFCSG